jgi:serine/threonine protein phosphatase PrpC
MMKCPECGQQAPDDAKFCDRCGQGFAGGLVHAAQASIPPLDPDTELKGRYRITKLLSSTARENRYRAMRMQDNEFVQLREQIGPASPAQTDVSSDPPTPPATEDDPAGPRAKTAELRLDISHNRALHNGSISEGSESRSVDDLSSELENQPETSFSQTPPRNDDLGASETRESETKADVHLLTEIVEQEHSSAPASADESAGPQLSSTPESLGSADDQLSVDQEPDVGSANDDLGDVFGRVLALSLTLNHPAFQRATAGFAAGGRVYLVYPDEELRPLALRPGGLRMEEGEALQVALQVCQAVSFVHRRGLRVNDICPESVAYAADGRIKLTGLDYLSNDNELQTDPIFNDGYTAPEIYRGRKVDKHADIFSIAALLYSCVTGERLDSETWREEAGPIRFYPPHVVTPALEQMLRRALRFDPAARGPNVDSLKAELLKLAARIQLRADALTDVGMVREHNEDSVLVFECKRDSLINPAQTFLYVVADGMGGAEAGEVASAIAVETIRNYIQENVGGSRTPDISVLLQEALEQANSKIIEYQATHPETRSMGSTAVAALINPPETAVAWVGDSRAYYCDNQGLRQLSRDHSLVQRLIEIGQISPEEARHHEHKNVITRSLGARVTGPAGAESLIARLKRGDRLLLCSDGLTAHVEDRQIEEILRRHSDPTAAVRELVVAANAGGGTDNISVVAIFSG